MKVEYSTFLLGLCVWREARSESYQGQRAVAHVVLNRVKAGWGDLKKVVTKKYQFSSMSTPGDSQLVLYPEDDVSFDGILKMCERVQDGTDPDLTEGALYYYNPKTATSPWFRDTIVADTTNHPKTATIGAHVFYR